MTGPRRRKNPDPFALVPAQLRHQVIIAGGRRSLGGTVDLNKLSPFSNKAGTGAAFYLAARGFEDRAPDQTGAQFLWSGTSFSAPTISGAVALLASAFPNLSGAEIVEILFSSADDLGAAGIDSIFGNGRLDIAQAFQPIGTTSLATTMVPVSTSTNGDLPPAAGDGGTTGNTGAIILDGYSRAYVLNSQTRASRNSRLLARASMVDSHGSASAGPVSGDGREPAPRPTEGLLSRMGTARRRSTFAPDRRFALAPSTQDGDRARFSESAKSMERRLAGARDRRVPDRRDIAGEPASRQAEWQRCVPPHLRAVGVTLSCEPQRVAGTRLAPRFALPRAVCRSTAASDRPGFVRLAGSMNRNPAWRRLATAFEQRRARTCPRHRSAARARPGWSGDLSGRARDQLCGGKFRPRYRLRQTSSACSGRRPRWLRLSQPLRIESGGVAMML